MAALRKHPPARMTLGEFFAWNPEDTSIRSWQLIDGEPVAMAPATDARGALQMEFGRLLGNHLLARGVPCRWFRKPELFLACGRTVTTASLTSGLPVPLPHQA